MAGVLYYITQDSQNIIYLPKYYIYYPTKSVDYGKYTHVKQ